MIEPTLRARRRRSYVVLAATMLVAAVGRLPYELLWGFPFLASFTLPGLHWRVRLVVSMVSWGILVIAWLQAAEVARYSG